MAHEPRIAYPAGGLTVVLEDSENIALLSPTIEGGGPAPYRMLVSDVDGLRTGLALCKEFRDQAPVRDRPPGRHVTLTELSRILRDEAWDGRWYPSRINPNVASQADHTAEVLLAAFAERKLSMVHGIWQ